MIGIYKITNTINGLSYVGKSRNIEKRFKKHEYCSHDKNLDKPLYNDIRKYGIDKFTFTVLEEVDSFDKCRDLEIHYINLYNSIIPNGYNKSNGPGCLGCKLEYRNKDMWKLHNSEAHKGKPNYKTRGRHLSIEQRNYLSDYFNGRPNPKNRGELNGMFGKTPTNKGKKMYIGEDGKRHYK